MDRFREYNKIPRLNRTIRVSEKIDGTNSAICISKELPDEYKNWVVEEFSPFTVVIVDEEPHYVWAQRRTGVCKPGKQYDNYGFAGWVWDNATELVENLGEGRWFGEWAGQGIQKAYPNATGKKFWLFPQDHLPDSAFEYKGDLYGFAPILYEGPFSQGDIDHCVEVLRQEGSWAYPGDNAEGVVIEWLQARLKFKVTLERDSEYKGNAL